MIKLAIVGSRNFTNYKIFKQIVLNTIEDFKLKYPNFDYSDITIVSGGADGTDLMAERFAEENNYELTVFEADWNKYGKAAGPIRNTKIVNECTHLIAFPSKTGSGTQDSIKKAKDLNKRLHVYQID